MDEAPGFDDVDGWINTDSLGLPSLEGRPVLVWFWTYSCPHCIHDLTAMKELWEAYRDEGLAVVGVHTPEFGFEEEQGNVEDAVERNGIGFPVALDPTNAVWEQHGNMQRPRQMLLGPQGGIRYESLGAGGHAALEEYVQRVIRQEGGDPGEPVIEESGNEGPVDAVSPDLYAGEETGAELGNDQVYAPHTAVTFTDDGDHDLNRLYLEGSWRREPRYVTPEGEGYAAVRFSGSNCYVVMRGKGRCTVEVDGGLLSEKHRGEDVVQEGGETHIETETPGMYHVVDREEPRISELTLTPESVDVRLYRFAFR